MTNTEKKLIAMKIKPVNAAKLVGILSEFWANGNANCDHYREELKRVTASPTVLDAAENLFREEFTDYDVIFQTPRLKTDLFWSKILEMIESVYTTGKCPFCGKKMFAIDNRQVCRSCNRAFSIKKKGIFNAADPNTIFKAEAVNG
jgi:hypothetical protein